MRRFAFRSGQAEGYDAANIRTAMGQVATHRYGAEISTLFLHQLCRTILQQLVKLHLEIK